MQKDYVTEKDITFGELRCYLSQLDRLSICIRETMSYENFIFLRDVPEGEWSTERFENYPVILENPFDMGDIVMDEDRIGVIDISKEDMAASTERMRKCRTNSIYNHKGAGEAQRLYQESRQHHL